MVTMQLPVWISIWITLFGKASTAYKTEYACPCHIAQLDCTSSLIIVINSSYGLNKGNCKQDSSCNLDTNECLAPYPNVSVLNEKCYFKSRCNISYTDVNLTDCGSQRKSDYLRVDYECVAGPSTTTPRLVTTTSNIVTSTSTLSTKVSSSDKQTSLGLTSTSLNGTSTTTKQTETSANTSSKSLTSTASLPTSEVISSDKDSSTALTSASHTDGEEHPERLIIILVVVVGVLVLSAILVIVFILHRRRSKQSSQEYAPKNQLPDVLINHSNMNFEGTDQDYKAVEISKYDEINDESIATYSRPVKKKTNGCTIAKDEKETGGNGATDEYDRIVFKKKCPVKMRNYDSVSAIEVKKRDDTYSHVSSQSKPASAGVANNYSHCQPASAGVANDYSHCQPASAGVANDYSHCQPASAGIANDYSHCQVIRNESRSNDNTYKTAVSNENLAVENYSHVDLSADKTNRRPSNIVEDDSYSHIEVDKTSKTSKNGHTVQTIPKYEGSQTFKDLQSLDAESEGWPICDRNYGVTSQDQPLQGIKAVSLPDNYIEFKIGDIYDTPRCKDQQYHVVLKGNKEQLLNRIETGSKQKSETEKNNGVIEDCAVSSDYELANPIDF